MEKVKLRLLNTTKNVKKVVGRSVMHLDSLVKYKTIRLLTNLEKFLKFGLCKYR